MFIPKCIRKGAVCVRHSKGKYTKWPCGSAYSPAERHAIFVSKKKPCKNCKNMCTAVYCRKCTGLFTKNRLLGKKLPEWWRKKISDGQGKGEQSKRWKGENAGYWSKHKWIVKQFGNPKECAHCKVGGMKNRGNRWTIQWANISKNYRRDISDYVGLCTKCHKIFDNKIKNHQHGTVARYRKGCRCAECVSYRKLYRLGMVPYK